MSNLKDFRCSDCKKLILRYGKDQKSIYLVTKCPRCGKAIRVTIKVSD
ncbi:MAG: hypothetical protein ACYDDH_10600 [Candidatus Desulforudaceae bacterium]